MNAIILALGGIRATVFAALAIVFLLVAGVQSWRLGASQDAYAAYRDKMIAATAKAAQAAATAREKSLDAREAYLWKSGEAENAYNAGRESAINYQNTVVADLRSGNLRLRNEWSACHSGKGEGRAAAGVAEGTNGESDVLPEAVGRVIGIGQQADLHVKWLQSELQATRQLYESCYK